MRKIFYSFIAMLGIMSAVSCGDMLEVESDNMVIDPNLNSKTDSVFYALGIAQAMQQMADQYFFVGEMRGDLVKETTYTNTNLRQLSQYTADNTNAYDSAYVYYKVINNCNYYLQHRDTTLMSGATAVTMEEYAAVEAIRAWTYLQLARTYGGNEINPATGKGYIPFFTEPLTAISQIHEENVDHYTLSQIVDALAPRLQKFSGYSVPTFGTNGKNYSIGSTNWGNAKNVNFSKIFLPVDVVLGEMYLENGQYTEAAKAYYKYLYTEKITSQPYNAFRFMDGLTDDNIQNFPTNIFSMLMTNSWNQIFSNSASPDDVVTYIPMAVSSSRGATTNVPLAFGYDYYSTDRSSQCPRTEKIQIVPSDDYMNAARYATSYYYVANPGKTYPDSVGYTKAFGDGRSNFNLSNGNSNTAMLNINQDDTTRVYIRKAMNANIILMRETTVWLHLAEALNRAGYPDAAFAVLRNGISTYLEEIVDEPTYTEDGTEVPAPAYKYIKPATIDYLTNVVPFLGAEGRSVFDPAETYGIHYHGCGSLNSAGIESQQSTKNLGSRNTSVGSQKNIHYLPEPIIGEKMKQIAAQFGVEVGTTQQDYINAMEDLLVDEYAMEFAFEGTRFYDLQRVARHKNESGIYGGGFGSLWFSNKLRNKGIRTNLNDPKNWYLSF